MRAALLVLALAFVGLGCGGDDTTSVTVHDMAAGAAHDMASLCGHPGDTGNSLGVGKYCTSISDCSSNSKATLCSILGSDNTYFCTFPCSGTADLATECGENATCACQGGQCGCFPAACE
ncbi:MAG TPA: hypothetical protein VGL86_05595 [Polyangia bacterium]|jgi:hypothetical protein